MSTTFIASAVLIAILFVWAVGAYNQLVQLKNEEGVRIFVGKAFRKCCSLSAGLSKTIFKVDHEFVHGGLPIEGFADGFVHDVSKG
jgi:hypothetical protein